MKHEQIQFMMTDSNLKTSPIEKHDGITTAPIEGILSRPISAFEDAPKQTCPQPPDFPLDLIPLSADEKSIHDRALRQAGEYKRHEIFLIESIEAVDRLRIFETFRLTSTFSYCTQILKLSDAVAYYFITIARAGRKAPELRAAVVSGELPVSKAAQICSVVTPANQSEWVKKAKTSSKADLEKQVAKASPKKAAAPRAKPVGENRTLVSFEADDDFMRDLHRVCNLECQRNSKVTTVPKAFRQALKAYLDAHDPILKAERAERRRASKTESKPDSSPSRGRKNSRATPRSVEIAPGKPNSSREESRRIPAEVQHQLHLRDHGLCQARRPDGTICGASRFTQIHHLVRWSAGGTHELSNLITLCSSHHRQWHRSGER